MASNWKEMDARQHADRVRESQIERMTITLEVVDKEMASGILYQLLAEHMAFLQERVSVYRETRHVELLEAKKMLNSLNVT